MSGQIEVAVAFGIIGFFVVVGLFFLMRKLMLWYFRIDDIIALLEAIAGKRVDELRHVSYEADESYKLLHPAPRVEPGSETWKCPKCGHGNPNDAFQCAECGYSLR